MDPSSADRTSGQAGSAAPSATGAPSASGALKERARTANREGRDRIIRLADEVWRTPELGFKEVRTAETVARFLEDLGLHVKTGLALTGVKAEAAGKVPFVPADATFSRPPQVAVLGELDAVICPGHPAADPRTGAAHACGHHAQLAVMAGVALGLVGSGVLDELSGSVLFMGVPAEEYVEFEYRLGLRREGKVEFIGGKPELIRLGEFDNVDMALLVHSGGFPGSRLSVGGTSNGFIGKSIRYVGREAHAGGAPWLGANALNSAMLAIAAINALRETWKDEDSIRVHPIITRGGDLVNIVPADVRLETYVRGRTMQAIQDAAVKVDRALEAGAHAIGTRVEIEDLPGFLPMLSDAALVRLYGRNLAAVVGRDQMAETGHMGGSTDMGDLSHIMPALHPYGAGVTGHPHGTDFEVVDPDRAYIAPAEAVALTVIDLLAGGAREADAIRRESTPLLTRAAYVELVRSLFKRTVYPEARG